MLCFNACGSLCTVHTQASLAERHGNLLVPDSEALPREELLRVNAQLRQALETARTELMDCFNAVCVHNKQSTCTPDTVGRPLLYGFGQQQHCLMSVGP